MFDIFVTFAYITLSLTVVLGKLCGRMGNHNWNPEFTEGGEGGFEFLKFSKKGGMLEFYHKKGGGGGVI